MSLLPGIGRGDQNHFSKEGNEAGSVFLLKGDNMLKEYDFSKSKKNPYAARLKKQITIRIDEDSIDYFKQISEEVGIPYQGVINLYLRDCVQSNRKLKINWK